MALGLSDLAARLEISKTSANVAVNALAYDGFLKIDVIGRVWRISCNQDHFYNFSRKISYNLIAVYESGILAAVHAKIPNPKAVILFGSYRKGDDTDKSDIDIAVEVLGDVEVDVIELGEINVGFRENVPVNLHIFSRKSVDINLFANIANGILLEGFLEVRP
ncbi:MAG: nucleotidyltransferase domain-containing protein [Candidatus Aenigmarchaeota archaeon]|nr:nucleotidyltransferase domain-containing protein [Candidatus Aenigmarchaeota archaeon]